MSSGTWTPSPLCISTGIPLPLLYTLTVPSSSSKSTRRASIVLSLTEWSHAFTRISSKILYNPGTNSMFL